MSWKDSPGGRIGLGEKGLTHYSTAKAKTDMVVPKWNDLVISETDLRLVPKETEKPIKETQPSTSSRLP